MSEKEAIDRANRWVASRFAGVPPIAFVVRLVPASIAHAEQLLGQSFETALTKRIVGSWCILFNCSWDTDADGLPERLGVLVDDRTGVVQDLNL